MAISRMQQPRQQYGLGSIVKKAVRGVKKIAKSPLGKAAIGGALMFGIPGTNIGGLFGRASLGGGATGLLGQKGIGATFGAGRAALANRFAPKAATGFMRPNMRDVAGSGKAGFFSKLNPFGENFDAKTAFLTGGAGLVAAPFLMDAFAPEEVEEEVTDVMDVGAIRQRARDYYMGTGGKDLAFMPQKQYVQKNFYQPNADGGRAGYANGMMVEDEEEEFIRSNAGMSRRQPKAFLNMGGGAGQAQAEQMLMAEYVKYKNKGGTLSFEQFVKAVMQQQAPEGAGMEQPQAVAMAANGGRIGYAGGQLVSPSGDGSRPGYAGPLDFFKNLKSGFGQIFSGETQAFLGDDQEKINEILVKKGYGVNLPEDTINMIIDGHKKGLDLETISSLAETDSGTVKGIIDMLSVGIEKKAYGGRIGKQEGGIMATDEAAEMIDMGGMEKDYRETGGFVEMGGKERADDVPARLSKNEFVFTADAVRNAGGGDIDKGAEVMENLMKNLEQGGEVSEESQGLEGARAMYDQQQMLQSRII